MARVCVYIDGFNLYYRALKGTPYRWLNPMGLAQRLLRPGDVIEGLRYFSARVSSRAGDQDAPRNQQIYFSALRTLPNLDIHLGRFLTKTKKRPLVSDPRKFVEILDTEEKGSDVNLAVHLLHDAWRGRFDAALVFSQDTDLIEPIRLVCKELAKPVGLVWLDGRQPNRDMAAAAGFVRHISQADLTAAQFPARLQGPGGKSIEKPQGW